MIIFNVLYKYMTKVVYQKRRNWHIFPSWN